MKKVLFALGLGAVFMNVAFADISIPENAPKYKEIMQKVRENPAVQACMQKGSAEEKRSCFQDLMEKARQRVQQ